MDDFSQNRPEDILPATWFPAEVEVAINPAAGRRAAIYSRYSFQGVRQSSIERQNENCLNYIRSNNLVFVATYEDWAQTGTNVGREKLQECLRDARAKRFDILVVEEIDRLGRKLDVTVDIWKELNKLGIEIHDAESGRLSPGQIGAKAGASDEERTKLVKRVNQGTRKKVENGGWVGNACFGYHRILLDPKSSKTTVAQNPSEAAIIKEIFELYDSGVSCDRIAKILNLRAADKRGKRFWTGHEIRGSKKYGDGFLRRLRYVGISVHGRNSTKKRDDKYTVTPNPRDKWAVGRLNDSLIIIDRGLFDRVQKRLNHESKGPRQPTFTVKDYPLGGLLYCASCGGKMTPTLKRKDGTPRAMCNRARNPNSIKPDNISCNNNRSTSIDQIDDMVREIICTEVANPTAFEAFIEEYNVQRRALSNADDAERPMLERELVKLEGDRDELWKYRDSFSDEFIDEKATKLTSDINSAKARLKALNSARKSNLAIERDAPKNIAEEVEAVFAPNFDAKTATGAKVLAALRRLIAKVIVNLSDDETSIEMHCNVAAVITEGQTAEVVKFHLRRPRTGHSPLHTELRRIDALVEAGTYALEDEEWQHIAPLIPPCVTRSKRGSPPVSARNVIDAALLHLHENVPLAHMPKAFGPPVAVFEGLRRLSSSGAWDVTVDKLRQIAPDRIPDKSSNMFGTVLGGYSTSLRGLPAIRARHGIEMAKGIHALTDEEWELVADLVPEQVLTVDGKPALITPRDFLHGVFYMLKTGTPISNMPLRLVSETYFDSSIRRFVRHGHWDEMLERLAQKSPDTLASANILRFNTYNRSSKERPVWRLPRPKAADMSGVPSHAPNDYEWSFISHLFPIEVLYVNDKLAVANARMLAHAMLYRVKEKIPDTAFPAYFGDLHLLHNAMVKFVFHHLWDEMVAILREKSPETLNNADLEIFAKYRRGKTHRYAHLLPIVEPTPPPHAPSDAQWSLVKDLIPLDILSVRGEPAIMEPRRFLHALLFMVTEGVQYGALPKNYFGATDDMRFVMRKFVRHHRWDVMVSRFRHFDLDWCAKVDLTMFDKLPRSKNENPEYRQHRPRRLNPA